MAPNHTFHLPENGLTTAEAVTLAQQLVNREKTKTQLINDGFNRYSLNSKEDLPSWFLDDESKHYKPNLPVTKEAIDILRALYDNNKPGKKRDPLCMTPYFNIPLL